MPSAFAFPIFRAVWVASLVSNLGSIIQGVGASWYVASQGGSPTVVALIQSATALPIVALSLFAGTMADSLDRRKIMLIAQCYLLLVSAGLAIVAWNGVLSTYLLLAFTFAIGCGNALSSPAWQASVTQMVSKDAVPNAVSMNSMGFNVARSAGPAVGGLIVATFGVAASFLLNALSYIGLIGVLAAWHPDSRKSDLPAEPMRAAITSGLHYAIMSRGLKRIFIRAFLCGLASAAIPALLPVIAHGRFSDSASAFGLLLGAFGVGAVFGGALSSQLRSRFSTEEIVRSAGAIMGVSAILLGAIDSLWVAALALIVAGFAWVLTMSVLNIAIQMLTPGWVLGRSLSIFQMASFGGMALGSWLAGASASQFTVPIALIALAFLQALGVGFGLVSPLPQAEAGLDESETQRDEALGPGMADLSSNDGPVVIETEYRVSAENRSAFIALMEKMRQMRFRNGAHSWTLLQDLTRDSEFTERYELTTWLEYRHFRSRFVVADRNLVMAVGALHEPNDGQVTRLSIAIPTREHSWHIHTPITDSTTCR